MRFGRWGWARGATLGLGLAGCSTPLQLNGEGGAPGADGAAKATRQWLISTRTACPPPRTATRPTPRAPGAAERCNEVDDDCDGETDEGVRVQWWADGDGAGPAGEACALPARRGDDCDDRDDVDPLRHPAADERCDGQDDDCDGEIDEGMVPRLWWPDGDGVGGDGAPIEACAPGARWASATDDCDDADPSVYPGKREDRDARDDDRSGLAGATAACPCVVEHRGTQPYRFCATGADGAAAQAACATVGDHLADAQDSVEDDWLALTASAYASTSWWLGATDLAAEGSWAWESGATWSYTHLCPSEPNNGHGLDCVPTTEEDRGVLGWQAGGWWNDYPCTCAAGQGQPYFNICEG